MHRDRPSARLSVIIPTYGRASLLRASLESLTHQTLPRDQLEVIVVDDGSADETGDVCRALMGDLPLRYFRIEHSGISAAKNLGIFTARAPIIFFFDDDDVASPQLLAEHLAAHERHPEETVAVLGYTTWVAGLEVTPLMHFVMNIGQHLFAYRDLTDGAMLEFGFFWGGRSSCKRSLLAQHGIFNRQFRGIIEDIELEYRLSKFGLRVVYNRQAVSYMNRPLDLDAFCDRVVRKGRALYLFGQVHPDVAVQEYCRSQGAYADWQGFKWRYQAQLRRARTIEAMLAAAPVLVERRELLDELWGLYQSSFEALTVKGFREGASGLLDEPVAAAPGGPVLERAVSPVAPA
jgi:glycosyltransferase involved in cell wall biosynthesis